MPHKIQKISSTFCKLISALVVCLLTACTTKSFTDTVLGTVQSPDCMETTGQPECSHTDETLYDRTPRAGIPDLHSNEALEQQAERLK